MSNAHQVPSRPLPRLLAEPAPRLTLLLASTQKEFRGGEVQLWRLAIGFRDAGHRVLAYARAGAPFVTRMEADGFETFSFAGRGIHPRTMLDIRRRLKQDRPDVVYCNDSHSLTTLGIAGWGLDIGARVAARRVSFPMRNAWQYRALSDLVVASSGIAADMARAGGVPPDWLDVVYDGVPLESPSASREECRARLGLKPDQFTLLSVAALSPEKGHSVMLAALSLLVKEHPRLVWLCAGDGALRRPLEDEAQRLGLGQHARFLGQRGDVPDLMAAADLLIMSSFSEGLCTAAIEALHARLPIVSTTAGGLVEVVGLNEPHGPVAWMAAPGEPDSIAGAISQALSSPDESLRLAERGKERAGRLFTLKGMVDGHLIAFRRAARRRCA